MTQLLFIVGIFVFFLSVYGAVMIGGYLLADSASDWDDFVTPASDSTTDATPDATPDTSTSDPTTDAR